jgi:hypothetical protein
MSNIQSVDKNDFILSNYVTKGIKTLSDDISKPFIHNNGNIYMTNNDLTVKNIEIGSSNSSDSTDSIGNNGIIKINNPNRDNNNYCLSIRNLSVSTTIQPVGDPGAPPTSNVSNYCSFTSNTSGINGSITGDEYSVNYNTLSDVRVKKCITSLTTAYCLDKINHLNPVSYCFFNDNTDKLYEGFIAHEMGEIFPDTVTGVSGETISVVGVSGETYTIVGVSGETYDIIGVSGETISVVGVTGETISVVGVSGETYDTIVPQQLDYTKIIASLVGSIKELNIKVTDLNNRVTLLENSC